jgi:hypothetical protein
MTKPEETSITNHSWADVVMEVIRQVGLPAVLVAGILFGFYMFYGLVSESHIKRDDALESQLKDSRQALLDIFTKSHELQRSQIENIQNALKVHSAIVEEISKQQEQILTFKKEAQDAREEADNLRKSVLQEREGSQGIITKLNNDIEDKKSDIEKRNKQLADLEDRIRARQESLQNRADAIEDLRKKLQILAKAVMDSGVARNSQAFGIALSVSQEGEQRFAALKRFAENGELSQAERQSFIGLPYETIRQLARDGTGFKFWLEDTANGSIYGVGRINDAGYYENFIQFLTDGEKTIEIATAKGIAASIFPETNNFFRQMVMYASFSQGEGAYGYAEGLELAPKEWFVADFLKARGDFDSIGLLGSTSKMPKRKVPAITTLFSSDAGAKFLAPEVFAKVTSQEEDLRAGDFSHSFPQGSTPLSQMAIYTRSKMLDINGLPFATSSTLTDSQNAQLAKSFKEVLRILLNERSSSSNLAKYTFAQGTSGDALGETIAKLLQYNVTSIKFVNNAGQRLDGKLVIERSGAQPLEISARLEADGSIKRIL